MRSTEQQLCPALYIAPSASDAAAAATSTSSQTYVGSLPPSSSCSLIIRGPASCAIRAPVAYEPVKKTPSTGCASTARPASAAPITTAKTSCGTPARCSSLPISSPVSVANSDGLYSTALPASSAGTKTLAPTKYG